MSYIVNVIECHPDNKVPGFSNGQGAHTRGRMWRPLLKSVVGIKMRVEGQTPPPVRSDRITRGLQVGDVSTRAPLQMSRQGSHYSGRGKLRTRAAHHVPLQM